MALCFEKPCVGKILPCGAEDAPNDRFSILPFTFPSFFAYRARTLSIVRCTIKPTCLPRKICKAPEKSRFDGGVALPLRMPQALCERLFPEVVVFLHGTHCAPAQNLIK